MNLRPVEPVMQLLLERTQRAESKLELLLKKFELLEARLEKPPESHLTAKQAAAYLGVAYSTFRGWACSIRQQKTGRYRKQDLDHFAATRKRK